MTAADRPDVVIIGAGIGGIYAVLHLRRLGFSVVGIEAAPEVGGVWYHNAYPGSRVDLESDTFCYFFDADLYREWDWPERYSTQKEVLAYLRHVADRFDVRKDIRFSTRVERATWDPAERRYRVETDAGEVLHPRFLITAAGQLSRPRTPSFAGLEDFQGEWYQTSRWPHHDVDLAGKRVGVIGTGSSGVQAITEIAKTAAHLTVFQRTPNYSAPAQNRRADTARRERLRSRFDDLWDDMLDTPAAGFMPPPAGPAADFSIEEQQQLIEERWAFGSQSLLAVFSDQGTDAASNALVADFVKNKVRQLVRDPDTAQSLLPGSYPIGTKRLILDTGYYDVYNQDNVDLVDLRREPIDRITAEGVRTGDRDIPLDVLVFALGFEAFTAGLDEANITNEHGESPTSLWPRGPRTYLGVMTRELPNLFMLTGPGSPSVLANMMVGNQYHVELVGRLLQTMREEGATSVRPRLDAQDRWTAHVAEPAEHLLRRQVNNYLVHVNADDGSRVFIPYTGGWGAYVAACEAEADSGFAGFERD